MTRSKWLSFVLVLGLVVAACGGSGGGPDTTTGGPGATQPPVGDTTTQPPTGATQPPASGDLGWFSVDGERVDATTVHHYCGPLEFGGPAGEYSGFEINVIGSSDGQNLQLAIDYIWTGEGRATSQEAEVINVNLWGGSDYNFGGRMGRYDDEDVWSDQITPSPNFTFSLDGDRYRGGPVTVYDEDDFDETHMIEWDLRLTPRPGAPDEC